MPLFGGLRSLYIRPVVRLTPLDQELLSGLQAKAMRPEEMAGRVGLYLVRHSLERLRMAGKAKPLPQGKWTVQSAAVRDEEQPVVIEARRGRRAAA